MASIDSNELENILINISEKYVNKIENLKNEQDKEHLKNINELLEKLQLSQSQLGNNHSLIHSLTHSFTHSLTVIITHLSACLLTCSLIYSFTYYHISWFE
jgi:hypothetical protein